MKRYFALLFFLSCSCTAVSPWRVNSIETGHSSFDSALLRYGEKEGNSLGVEFIRTGEEISSFLSLHHFKFRPSSLNPPQVAIRLSSGKDTFEEALPLLEGNMRLRLSPKAMDFLFTSLQKGEKVAILVDGFEEVLQADGFQEMHRKWQGKASFFQHLFKGPLE